MIQLVISILVGAGLLFSLYVLARRDVRPEGASEALLEARLALNTLKNDLLPHEVVGRIFAKDDLDYVRAVATPTVVRLFLRQRKSIAVSWIDRIYGQIVRLKRFHLGRTRSYAKLQLRAEIALAVDFATLLFVCRLLRVLLYVRGPYAAPQMIGTTVGIVEKVCGISERSLAFLEPANATSLGGASGGTLAGV